MASEPLRGRVALDALASPARQELISLLGDRPATVRELASALGRSRQALHYHVGKLERAGLIRGASWRGTGPSRERIYAVARPRLTVAATEAAADRPAARRAIEAMLRLTGRELDAALADPNLRRRGTTREFCALRGKARLTRAELGRLNRLLERIEALLRSAKRGRGRRHYAITLVLTPARTAAPAPRGRP